MDAASPALSAAARQVDAGARGFRRRAQAWSGAWSATRPERRRTAQSSCRDRISLGPATATGTTCTEYSVATAIARYVPFGGQTGGTSFRVQDQPPGDPRRLPSAGFNAVSPEFFGMLRTPVLAGRVFEARDSQEGRLVAVVNEAFVSQYLREKNPIGVPVWLSRMKDRSAEIVGVVAEIREDSDQHTGYPQIYVPFAQEPSAEAYLIVRLQSLAGAPANPIELLPEIRRRIAAIDPRQPLFDAKMLDDRLNEGFAPFRIVSGMLVWFGFSRVDPCCHRRLRRRGLLRLPTNA